jgi:hypothetical protein
MSELYELTITAEIEVIKALPTIAAGTLKAGDWIEIDGDTVTIYPKENETS